MYYASIKEKNAALKYVMESYFFKITQIAKNSNDLTLFH